MSKVREKCDRTLPGGLKSGDLTDIMAMVVLLVTLTLVSVGSLDLQNDMVKMIIYASLATLFGTKVLKSRNGK